MKLGDHKGRKVTEPDFGKKFMIWRYLRKCLQLSVGWLLGSTILSETDLRILLILCMKLGDYKGRKVTQPDFWKKYWFGDICEKVSKLALVGWLVDCAVFSETALRIFLIFCMQLGDYKGRKVTARFLKKILNLEIFVKRSPS